MDSSPMNEEFLQAYEDNPDAEIISITDSSPTAMMGEIVLAENNALANHNTAIRQERDGLVPDLIRAAYNDNNGQQNANIPIMESPERSNEALSQSQRHAEVDQMQAELDDPAVDPIQFENFVMDESDDLMELSDATDQDIEDLISGNEQARFVEVRSNQEPNVVIPAMIVNTQNVAAIMLNAGIHIGDEEYLVDLMDGVANFSPIDQFQMMDSGIF